MDYRCLNKHFKEFVAALVQKLESDLSFDLWNQGPTSRVNIQRKLQNQSQILKLSSADHRLVLPLIQSPPRQPHIPRHTDSVTSDSAKDAIANKNNIVFYNDIINAQIRYI